MDKYDKEWEVEALDGNRSRNLDELKDSWERISRTPKIGLIMMILSKIMEVIGLLVKKQAEEAKKVEEKRVETQKLTIADFAEGIKQYEGFSPGSRSQRNNNPGNLKFVNQAGTTGEDTGGFAIFSTYDLGWQALLRQLRLAVTDKSLIYKSKMTLIEFFAEYAPRRDNNNPVAYASFIAQRFRITPQSQINIFSAT